jgi:hypothetical protein
MEWRSSGVLVCGDQGSDTPTLHYSITPSLHHSITPSLRSRLFLSLEIDEGL